MTATTTKRSPAAKALRRCLCVLIATLSFATLARVSVAVGITTFADDNTIELNVVG